MKARILHICSDTNIGGAGRYVLTLLAQFAMSDRYEVAVATPEGALAAALRRARITTLLYPGADRSFSVPALLALFRLIRAYRPQVVHAHGSLAGRVAGALAGVRIVYTKHGLAAAEEESVQVRDSSGILKRVGVRLFADRIAAVSEAVRTALVAAGADPSRVVLIPGGVDPSPYLEAPPPVPGVIGALGRLSREKGFDLLLRAMAILRGDEPGAAGQLELRLILGGDGSQRAALTRQAAELGLGPAVELTGFVSDVPGFLGRTGIFVLPARSEGLGLVLVEAMAAGRPVVAARVGGIPEVVVHGETGLLVPPEEPEALAAALRTLLEDPDLARRMGEAGRRRAVAHFGPSAMAAQTAALYEELLR